MYNRRMMRPIPMNGDRFGGGFFGPFLLGGITGGLLAPAFYPRPYPVPYLSLIHIFFVPNCSDFLIIKYFIN